jgi:hypothetical protein
VAVLVLLPTSAGAWIIAPDLGSGISWLLCWRFSVGTQRLIVTGVLILDVLHIGVLSNFLDIFRRANLHSENDARHFLAHHIEQTFKEFKCLTFVFLLRVFSVRSRANEYPDADDPAPTNARASAYQDSAT